jgi:trimeric autotransporter adhesin
MTSTSSLSTGASPSSTSAPSVSSSSTQSSSGAVSSSVSLGASVSSTNAISGSYSASVGISSSGTSSITPSSSFISLGGPNNSSNSSNIGLIIGIIIGMLALIALVTFGILYWRRQQAMLDRRRADLNRGKSLRLAGAGVKTPAKDTKNAAPLKIPSKRGIDESNGRASANSQTSNRSIGFSERQTRKIVKAEDIQESEAAAWRKSVGNRLNSSSSAHIAAYEPAEVPISVASVARPSAQLRDTLHISSTSFNDRISPQYAPSASRNASTRRPESNRTSSKKSALLSSVGGAIQSSMRFLVNPSNGASSNNLVSKSNTPRPSAEAMAAAKEAAALRVATLPGRTSISSIQSTGSIDTPSGQSHVSKTLSPNTHSVPPLIYDVEPTESIVKVAEVLPRTNNVVASTAVSAAPASASLNLHAATPVKVPVTTSMVAPQVTTSFTPSKETSVTVAPIMSTPKPAPQLSAASKKLQVAASKRLISLDADIFGSPSSNNVSTPLAATPTPIVNNTPSPTSTASRLDRVRAASRRNIS